VANTNPYLPTSRSGFTGPSERIGGSSPYHIDLKILQSLPYEEKIRALDSLAAQYKGIGREIEFSNQAVSGRRWNPNASPEEKKALFEAATGAHAARPGWDPLDFYVPFAGKSRFDEGAVEGASIFIPGVPGGKITRGAGGGYGYFSEAVDPSGRVVFRVGHGDTDRPEEQGEILVAEGGQITPADTTAATPQQTKAANEVLEETLEKLTQQKETPTLPRTTYEGPSEESFQKTEEEINRVATQLMLKRAAEQREEQAIPTIQRNVGALAASLGQKGFGTPKSVI
jgi:hypothetical protein